MRVARAATRPEALGAAARWSAARLRSGHASLSAPAGAAAAQQQQAPMAEAQQQQQPQHCLVRNGQLVGFVQEGSGKWLQTAPRGAAAAYGSHTAGCVPRARARSPRPRPPPRPRRAGAYTTARTVAGGARVLKLSSHVARLAQSATLMARADAQVRAGGAGSFPLWPGLRMHGRRAEIPVPTRSRRRAGGRGRQRRQRGRPARVHGAAAAAASARVHERGRVCTPVGLPSGRQRRRAGGGGGRPQRQRRRRQRRRAAAG
jgi:hypothetical protein